MARRKDRAASTLLGGMIIRCAWRHRAIRPQFFLAAPISLHL